MASRVSDHNLLNMSYTTWEMRGGTGVLRDVRSRSTLRVVTGYISLCRALILASASLHLNRFLALRYFSVCGRLGMF